MGFDRRQFLKAAAGFGAGAAAGALVTPLPWTLLDDIAIWSQNWSWIPSLKGGPSSFVPAVSKTCPSSAALTVRLAGGRPVRVLPNRDHPLGGGVTALAAAELQLLNSPARVATPLKRGKDGRLHPVEWSEATRLLFERLEEAGENVAFISGDENGSVNEVISAFASALGTDRVFLMPSEGQCASRACDFLGLKAQLGYDLENSDFVLAIGANILETWGTVARNRRIFGASRPHPQEGPAPGAVFAYAGPVQNNSAAVAAPWLPIRPGTGLLLALGIAHQLIARGRSLPARDFGLFAQMTADFGPEAVSAGAGLPGETLLQVVDSLLAARSPLVIVGGEFNQGAGAAPIMAAYAVNALLGNINARGGLRLLPEAGTALPGARDRRTLYRNDLPSWTAGGQNEDPPQVLVVHEANPLFALPDPAATADFFRKIPFKVAFASLLDETAAQSDLVLPIPMGMERADDICNPYGCGAGIYCLTLPVAPPHVDARATPDILLFLARQMGMDFGMETYGDLLRAKALRMRANPDLLAAGIPVLDPELVSPAECVLRPDILAKTAALANQEALSLALWSKLSLGTPTTGIPPFNTKTLRSAELAGEDMSALLNSATAGKCGIRDGRAIAVRSGKKRLTARARIFEGVADNTVALCLGYGHTALDGFSRNKGGNAMELVQAKAEPGTGLAVWDRTDVNVSNA
ncbi:MAG: molybdopterin-dependent oxidoreductase [Desulfovibrio sp.]|jgi:anaerobic selenocysteine-containing dehydrogenase|nr:molybdopterin-dependent oxidoreductase [Desulfovibrio sp.]